MRISRLLRSGVPALLALTMIGSSVSPAEADHAEPFDGPDHAYGEMVDYDLTFPVQGDYWYSDWFWASRAEGLHHAQDIFAEKGTPVVAAHAGTVIRVNSTSDPANPNPEKCCSVVVVHDDGWETRYIHLDNDTPGTDDGLGWGVAEGIAVGVRVEAGQLIGYLGDSGTAEETQPHLHFELADPDGVIVNPHDALLRAEGRATCSVTDPGPLVDLLSGTGFLRKGSRGAAVAELQALATAFGHDAGPIDGIFGSRTHAAVVGLQGDLGVDTDGVVGPQTRTAIAELATAFPHLPILDPDGRAISWAAVGGDVEDLQALLTLAGYEPGPVDGAYGPMTLEAVKALQTDRGLDVDGIVGAGTRAALADSVGVTALIDCVQDA